MNIPIIGWRDNQNQFPILANGAKDYLAIVATEVSSEVEFYQAGLIDNKTRSSLHTETVREIMCLESWNKIHDL